MPSLHGRDRSESVVSGVVILSQEFKYIKIERDEAVIRDLIQIESDFWHNHVLPKIMPEPDGSNICDEVIKQYYPAANRELVPNWNRRNGDRRKKM